MANHSTSDAPAPDKSAGLTREETRCPACGDTAPVCGQCGTRLLVYAEIAALRERVREADAAYVKPSEDFEEQLRARRASEAEVERLTRLVACPPVVTRELARAREGRDKAEAQRDAPREALASEKLLWMREAHYASDRALAEKARADKAEAEVERLTRERDGMDAMLTRIASTVDDYFHAPAEENVADGVDALMEDKAALEARAATVEAALREIALEHADGCDYMEYGKPCNCAKAIADAAIKEAGE